MENSNSSCEASSNSVALETRGLSKHFGGIKAIDGIDMKLYKNEILGIVGDNGAGKSTLIKTITGVYKKDGGDIYIDGKEVEINSIIEAKKLGIETVYQDGGLIKVIDGPANVFLGREKVRKDIFGKVFRLLDFKYMRNETVKLLEEMGIKLKEVNAPTVNLSGGQQQSIAVGRAIHWCGNILIFDEPTNNLGVNEQKIALELIKNIRNKFKNISIIIITHNLFHVFEVVDRIMVLKNGKVVGNRLKDKTSQKEIVSLISGIAV